MTLPIALWRGLARVAGPFVARRIARRHAAEGVAARRLPERRGVASLARPDGRLIWLHAASVGESLSALPLVAALLEDAPDLTCLVTTGTATSAEILSGRLPPRALHQFAPLDSPPMVRRFLRHWQPDLLVLVESELWPVMLTEVDRAGIPRAFVNARLSRRSLDRWQRFPRTARQLLAPFRLTAAQDAVTTAGLRDLGASPVAEGCDLKAAAAPPPADPVTLADLRARIGGRPVWAAVSTHPGEEELVLAAHQAVRQTCPDALLILCPRHPARADQIAGMMAPMARRSLGKGPEGASVWLVDTLGETGLWFRLAPVTFLGGSLVDVGGHNPWEPARSGTAILHGPFTGNAAAAHALLDAGGAARAITAETLGPDVAGLLSDPVRAQAIAAAGGRVAEAQADQTRSIARALIGLLASERAD